MTQLLLQSFAATAALFLLDLLLRKSLKPVRRPGKRADNHKEQADG